MAAGHEHAAVNQRRRRRAGARDGHRLGRTHAVGGWIESLGGRQHSTVIRGAADDENRTVSQERRRVSGARPLQQRRERRFAGRRIEDLDVRTDEAADLTAGDEDAAVIEPRGCRGNARHEQLPDRGRCIRERVVNDDAVGRRAFGGQTASDERRAIGQRRDCRTRARCLRVGRPDGCPRTDLLWRLCLQQKSAGANDQGDPENEGDRTARTDSHGYSSTWCSQLHPCPTETERTGVATRRVTARVPPVQSRVPATIR